MKKLSWIQLLLIVTIGAIATYLIGVGLFSVDNWFVNVMKRNVSIYSYIDNVFHIPLLGSIFDASTEVLQIIAQILMTLALAEQWVFWLLTNIITIIMWGGVIIADKTSLPWALPTLIMWIAYLINSVYGYINWRKGTKANV
jgi:nicotinamide mononucleotide transporter